LNRIENNTDYGIYLENATSNKIYNNLFNNTANFYFKTIYANYWNTTRQAGERIHSPGTEIGGNYWTNPAGNGFSDTCTDANKDGFCDSNYTLTTDNVDYLPLSDEYRKRRIHIYNFSENVGVDRWAYWANTSAANNGPPANPWIQDGEFTSDEYQAVSASDDNRATTGGGGVKLNPFHRFDFKISESIDTIMKLEFYWEGYGDAGSSTLYVWNWTTSSWELLGSHSNTASDGAVNASRTRGIEGYVNSSGYLHLLAVDTAHRPDFIKTDYVHVKVFFLVNPPTWSNNGTNVTESKPSEWVLHYVKWYTKIGNMDYFIFESNYSGSPQNETYSFNGNVWSNVTKQMPSTPGIYYWKVCANNSYNRWNCTEKQYVVVVKRWLEVDWSSSSEINSSYCSQTSPCEVIQYNTFNASARVRCRTNPPGHSCGEIFGSIRYNESGTEPNAKVEVETGISAPNPSSCGSLSDSQLCILNWTINASGEQNSVWALDVNFSSSSYNLENDTANSYVRIIATKQFNLTVYNSTGQVSDALIKIYKNGQLIHSAVGHVAKDLNFKDNYTLEISKKVNDLNLTARIEDLNITKDLSVTSQIVETYTGYKPIYITNLTSIFALNDTGLNYSYVNLSIPKEGINVNKILHCTNWNFSSGECYAWEVNDTSDYEFVDLGNYIAFNVTSFTAYAGGAGYNSNLTIWDETDPEGGSKTKYINEQVKFFANYTNSTSGESINGTNVYCNISFNISGGWTDWQSMSFNSTSLLYEYNRSFDQSGVFNWNVSCNGSALGYDALEAMDSVEITAEISASPCQVYINASSQLPYTITQSNTYYCLNASGSTTDTAISFASGVQNSTLDCQGFYLNGDDSGIDYGVYLTGSSTKNNTIKNCNITDFYYGIYLYNGPNNNSIINSTANSNTYGIHLFFGSSNKIINSTTNGNYDGIYLTYSSNNQIINSTLSENSHYDFHISAGSDSECNNYLANVTGSNNLPIKYFNSSVSLSNEVLSELILCNADYSNITNVTIDGSPTKKNNGLLVVGTDYSNFTQINSSNNYDGIFLFSSSNNQIINSTANSNDWGIYLYSSSNNQIINSIANSNFDGIHFYSSSNNNQIINSTANGNTYGIYLYSSSNNNQIINSTANGNTYGIYLYSSSNNTITGGSVWNNTNDYYLQGAGSTNNFTQTNFTGPRIIYFYDVTSWFNYNNRTDIELWLKTNISAQTTITRKLLSWSKVLMKWNDSSSQAVIARYNITGLHPNKYYLVYNNSELTYTLQTDSNGNLPSFIIYLSSEHEIKVEEDSQAPQYFLNSTNSTIAGSAVSHNLFWQDNVNLSHAIFSFDNCTGSLQNISTISLSGTEDWSNFTVGINSTVGCTIRWCVYANDTNNNWNYSSCENPFSYETTGCSISIGLSDALASGIIWNVNSLPATNLPAEGNSEITQYNISISITGSCTVNLYIKANDELTSNGYKIGIGNETYCYNTTDPTVPGIDCYQLDTDYQGNQIGSNLADGSHVYLKFYLDVPAGQPPGNYNNTISIKGVKSGEQP